MADPTAPVGPVSERLTDRVTFGAIEQLDHEGLLREHRASAKSPRRHASLSARALFATMDRLYGTERTLEKFRVLELVARVPYQAWEHVAYVAMTHRASRPGFARRVFDTVRLTRWEQDNEQWHLLTLEELTSGEPQSFVRHRLVPQLLAFAYYQLSWAMYVVKPAWSYRLNADFEDHSEHEYALLVDEHPEWESTPYESAFASEFGDYDSLADLFRQICYDERLHKLESEVRMGDARFR